MIILCEIGTQTEVVEKVNTAVAPMTPPALLDNESQTFIPIVETATQMSPQQVKEQVDGPGESSDVEIVADINNVQP